MSDLCPGCYYQCKIGHLVFLLNVKHRTYINKVVKIRRISLKQMHILRDPEFRGRFNFKKMGVTIQKLDETN